MSRPTRWRCTIPAFRVPLSLVGITVVAAVLAAVPLFDRYGPAPGSAIAVEAGPVDTGTVPEDVEAPVAGIAADDRTAGIAADDRTARTTDPRPADTDDTAVSRPAEIPEVSDREASVPPTVGEVEVAAQLTGPGSTNRTDERWNVHGTDLGHMFRHDGELFMVFGDTFGPGGFGGRAWRSNVMARIADPDPRNGLTFAEMISGVGGQAVELLGSRKIHGVERTVIPTYGTSIGGRMYLHYMSVRTWNGPGRWDVRHSGFAYSDDGGRTWTKDEGARWPDGSGFAQVAMVRHDGYLYLFGIPEGRFGGVRLARVRPASILDLSAYRYWDGTGWSPAQADAVQIVPGPVGELSVRWSESRRTWLMLYLNEERSAIVLRTATDLTGPWTDEQGVVGARKHPQLYAPYLVPTETGDDVYFTMSRYDIYNVLLMRMRLE